MGGVILKWDAPEYLYEQKSPDWFWAVGIIGVSVAATAVILNNVLFAVFIILSTFTIFMYAKRRPLIVENTITESGIQSGKEFYSYSAIKAFWINTNDENPRILLKTDRFASPLATILIDKTSHERVRQILLNHILEEEIQESLSQKIAEYLGF